MKKIDGVAKSISDVLSKKKYSIDYYQREYRWETKQLTELTNDLTAKFDQAWEPSHQRSEVGNYPYYFLGSIIISEKDGQRFIVDGQQRLTSLTLLLTYLRRLQAGSADTVPIDDLIFSSKFGSKSFNLDVPDRVLCMEALFDQGTFNPPSDAPESVTNLVERYEELDTLFPQDLRTKALPFFIDWLVERVQVVEITAYADDDAYSIFETMNDRGLKLTPADMLKGYLLANIDAGKDRLHANDLWRKTTVKLRDVSDDADADFLKTWLRSQYSTKIRESKKASKPEDWDRIGTEFHRWLRGAHASVGLKTNSDFYDFIARDYDFYSQQYMRIARASANSPDLCLRLVAYNADQGFTLQEQLLLAPLKRDDTQADLDRKLELVARYVDILLAWRIWNFRSTAYSTNKYTMFNVMRGIRGLGVDDLAKYLHQNLLQETQNFDTRADFGMHQQNKWQIHRLLARMTDYVGLQSGQASHYAEFVNGSAVKYEVEHIWADHFVRHDKEFSHQTEFARHRNLIGGLLLLPKSFNASYNDDTFEKKRPHYFGQNILAQSLHPSCYTKNPGFVKFLGSSQLPFKPYDSFMKADVEERSSLYRELAKVVWDPKSLLASQP